MIEFKRLNHVEAAEYKKVWTTIADLMNEHGVRGFNFPAHVDFLTDIVSLVVGICPHCYENGKDCQCWNDE